MFESVGYDAQIAFQFTDQIEYFFGVTQQLDTLSVRVVAHTKRTFDGFGKLSGTFKSKFKLQNESTLIPKTYLICPLASLKELV